MLGDEAGAILTVGAVSAWRAFSYADTSPLLLLSIMCSNCRPEGLQVGFAAASILVGREGRLFCNDDTITQKAAAATCAAVFSLQRNASTYTDILYCSRDCSGGGDCWKYCNPDLDEGQRQHSSTLRHRTGLQLGQKKRLQMQQSGPVGYVARPNGRVIPLGSWHSPR